MHGDRIDFRPAHEMITIDHGQNVLQCSGQFSDDLIILVDLPVPFRDLF